MKLARKLTWQVARLALVGVLAAVAAPLRDQRLPARVGRDGRGGAGLRAGLPLLFINQDEPIVTGQIQSFSIVLAILTVLMILVFRSFRIGLVAMIPNVMPIAVMLGLLGWLGMALDGFTAMMASVAIGIGVDDTIHFMHHLRAELRRGATLSEAITATLTGVGRALTFTSVVLALGFGVFMLATFLGTVHFGFLTAVAVVAALLADLLVLPAVLLLVGVPKSWLPGPGLSKE